MAISVYIGSTSGFAGKNLILLSMALKLQQEGYKIGFMKPVGFNPFSEKEVVVDKDALFIKDVLKIEDPLDLVTPVVFTYDLQVETFTKGCKDFKGKIKEAYEEISKGKDIVFLCGSGSFLYMGKFCEISGIDIAKLLKAKVILIDRFFKEFLYDYVIATKEVLDKELIGVILNGVPETKQSFVSELLVPMFKRKDIEVLGVIPEDPFLRSIKVSEIAERLGGKIIVEAQKSDTVVENFLIGTMQVENFMVHFKKRKNSAVIVGGDRSDIQLVAIESGCPCLILTGNLYPNDIILSRAEVHKVPIIVVREDTYTVAKMMEEVLSSIKLTDINKVNHGFKLISSNLNWDFIKKSLGL